MTESKSQSTIGPDEEATRLLEQKTDIGDFSIDQSSVPRLGFLFFGFVGLLCFNFFLQVIGYLEARTKPSFISAGNTVYGISNNIGQLLGIFIGSRMPVFTRIWTSCTLIALAAIGFPAMVNSHVPMGFVSALGITCILGLGNAIFQSAGFGLAGVVGPKALNYMSFGQSVAGLLTWPALLVLEQIFTNIGLSATRIDRRPSRVDSAAVVTGFAVVAMVTVSFIPFYAWSLRHNSAVKRGLEVMSQQGPTKASDRRAIPVIVAYTLPLAVTVWIVLFVTFLAFPSVMLSWEPMHAYPGGPAFYYSMLVYVFQVFDAVGKFLAIVGVTLSPMQVKVLAPWRFVLALAFFAAQASLPVFNSDVVRILLVALLAATNGLYISWCMIHGPGQVRSSEADIAGSTMSFFLVNGIFFGSLTALIIGTFQKIRPDLAATGTQFVSLAESRDLVHQLGGQ